MQMAKTFCLIESHTINTETRTLLKVGTKLMAVVCLMLLRWIVHLDHFQPIIRISTVRQDSNTHQLATSTLTALVIGSDSQVQEP